MTNNEGLLPSEPELALHGLGDITMTRFTNEPKVFAAPSITQASLSIEFTSDEATALRDELARFGAMLRPSPGAANAGLTPAKVRSRLGRFDSLRVKIATTLEESL